MAGFAYGVDLGWVSQLEDQGYSWVEEQGKVVDPIQAAKKCGADSVRLRVFVNPPKDAYWTKKNGVTCMLGYCASQDVLKVSKRVKALGMRLMIDFHYSDHFADPQYQDLPARWSQDTIPALHEHVYRHTKDVLTLLKENKVEPEWVQVGNEINSGLLLPRGSFRDAPETMVGLLNTGYDAVKEVFPNCQVVTHLSAGHMVEVIQDFFDTFFSLKGKTDIIGLSHYPYWFNMYGRTLGLAPVESTADYLYSRLHSYWQRYHKPMMICEVGELDADEGASYDLVAATVQAVKRLPDGYGAGVFYWEPEANAAVLPDQYPLGAAQLLRGKQLQYTKALHAYRDNNK